MSTISLSAVLGAVRPVLRAAPVAALWVAALAAQSPSSFLLVNNLPGTFTDISTTGVVLGSGDEGSFGFTSGVTNALVPSPTLFANTNGLLTASFFSGTTAAWQNTALPVASQTLGLFAMWDDLVIDGTASLRHQLVVENGIQVEVVQWSQVRTFSSGPSGPRATLQIKLFASGPVLAQFLYLNSNCATLAASSTIGAQWSSTGAAQYSLNTAGSVAAGTVLSVIPPEGLFAGFTAATTRGASPLEVQFTDTSWTTDPAGITTWAWDFNGDGVVDSGAPNPTWNFGSGSFTVSLTVTDATHAPNTLTRTNYVVTDLVTPNFNWQALGNNVVQFTDATTPAATSWAWDFNGDGVADETTQNPTWTFPAAEVVRSVRLTASRLSGAPASTVKQVMITAQGLATTFVGGLGSTTSGTGNCFDLTVTNPAGISINGVAMCPRAATTVAIGTPLTVDMYITRAPGGYANNHSNQDVWRHVGTGTGFYRGGTVTAPVAVNMSFGNSIYLPPGTYGVALHMNGCGLVFTQGTTSNLSYGNADLSLSMGLVKTAPFNSGALFSRVWNGVVFYDLGGQTDFTPPSAEGGNDTLVTIGDVHLDGSQSSDDRSAMQDLTYEWTLLSKPSASNATLNAVRFGPTGSWFHVDVWGEYRVSLVVIDEQGNHSQPDVIVFTLPQDITPPTAYAGDNQSIHVGNWIYLDGGASYDDITTRLALVYEWTVVSAPTGSNPSLFYGGPNAWNQNFVTDTVGEYRISLVVIDEQGNRSAPSEVVLSTTNMVPVAIAGPDHIVVVNSPLFILGDGYDPDNDYLYFSWTITSAPTGSNATLGDPANYLQFLTPDLVGTYELSLVVHDPWGGYSVPDTMRVVVVTPTELALINLGEASAQIGTFAPSAFDAPGHQNSLRNQLAQIATLIRNNNLTQARAHLWEMISRTDGWYLRSAFDPKGLGQPYAADFILGQYEQYEVFIRLDAALYYINQ